jgi:hypothetical protein
MVSEAARRIAISSSAVGLRARPCLYRRRRQGLVELKGKTAEHASAVPNKMASDARPQKSQLRLNGFCVVEVEKLCQQI